MVLSLAKKIFGTANDRIVKKLYSKVYEVSSLEETFQKLSDIEIKSKTAEFKQRISSGKETSDDILAEAFAVVREASKRCMGMRHFDVQILGGIILHKGMVAEMKTGEGKTLVATLAAYLNALQGKGVHVVTVNDYLAKRDSEWMGRLYGFLGLSTSCILNEYDDLERKEAYSKDITYGTNNEFGFDYLRDNMKFDFASKVQREFHYAILDEVDSILIDEARTPLVISGPTEGDTKLYYIINNLINLIDKSYFEIDQKSRSVILTEEGNLKVELLLKEKKLLSENESMYNLYSMSLVHHIDQALKAHNLFKKDVDYVVKDKKIMIIDEFTGRMMDGRRYSDGLHQALEAKEGLVIQNENQTLASVTFQNYFRMYDKLSGMTGTAMTEAEEFSGTYGLDVVSIPPNIPVSRIDENDEIYCTDSEKNKAVVDNVAESYKRGQPVLVGTVSIEKSEEISRLLKDKKIPHNVLNAKRHAQEAEIISQAGRYEAVTIATNMAGRGTDIMLGGNYDMIVASRIKSNFSEEKIKLIEKEVKETVESEKEKVIASGGLYVIGTERHESRRIDNQLRGRSGRQGDIGKSKFYLSLEDDLMRIFGSDKISGMLQKLGLSEGEAITHPWINHAVEKAQKKVEAHNYEIRKNLLRFDDVMNDQRKVIYEQRVEIMQFEEVTEIIYEMIDEIIEDFVDEAVPPNTYLEQWDLATLDKEILKVFGKDMEVSSFASKEGVAETEILEYVREGVYKIFKAKEEKNTKEIMRLIEKKILLVTLDQMWKDHLLSLDNLRQGIGLRAYGQKDPLNEYKKEAFYLFRNMLYSLKEAVVARVFHVEVDFSDQNLQEDVSQKEDINATPKEDEHKAMLIDPPRKVSPESRNPLDPSSWGKVSRNESCPCGSSKKYKFCHGKVI